MSLGVRLQFALVGIAGLSAVLGYFSSTLLGESPWVMPALVLVCCAVAFVVAKWLAAFFSRPLGELFRTIEDTFADGDLTRRATVQGAGDLASMAEAYNRLMSSFQVIIGKVYFNSVEVGRAAQELIAESRRVASGSEGQYLAAQETTLAMSQLSENMNLVSARAHETAMLSQNASELCGDGVVVANDTSAEMERIALSVTRTAEVVRAMGERSSSISGIVQAIREIADQTNLLALNAAIEAARAGEQGRGFAVVADEVRKLAERTSTATVEITAMIGAIQAETTSAIEAIELGSTQARSGAEMARKVADGLQRISRGAAETMEKVDAIAASIQQQSAASEDISLHINTIRDMSQSNSAAAELTLQEAGQLDQMAASLRDIEKVFRLGRSGSEAVETHKRMVTMVGAAASKAGDILSASVANRRIKLDDLFDQTYTPIANTKPQKFKTRFDDLCDQLLPALQESLLANDHNVVYAICCDRKGYVPTHNKRFSQPLTGNEKIDFVNNRTKRIFGDEVGQRCGSHQQAFLIQTYRRDTGEIMHDISAPIFVEGRQWGGFRIGYRTET